MKAAAALLKRLNLTSAKLLLVVIVFITFFINNRTIEPDIMESRNLVTAREMVEKGNILVPTMNDELRFEKPPLPTWLSAVVEYALPDDIAAQRALAALAGVLLTVFFYRLCSRVLKVNPVWATIILCTCYNFMLMARTVSWDIYCHAFMMGGIYFFARAMTGDGRQLWRFVLAGVWTGLSLMSKGPVSLFALFLPFILAFCLSFRPSVRGKWGGIVLMVVIALAVGGWWYAYIHCFHADELRSMINRESGAWMGRNVRPWHYYKLFFLEAGIWAVMFLTSIFTVGFAWRRAGGRKALVPLFWMLFCLVLLSIIPEKKNRYLMPMLIPAAMLMAQTVGYWTSLFRSGAASFRSALPFRINGWLLAAVCAGLPAAAWVLLVRPGYSGVLPIAVFAVISLCCCAVLVRSAVKLRPGLMVAAVGIVYAAAVALALPGAGKLINNPEMTGLDLTVGDTRLEGIPFRHNAAEELRIELVYAARRDIKGLDLNDTAAVISAMPMAWLSHTGASELPQAVLNRADTLHIGVYDCNRRPKGTRRYSQDFIYHLTLVTPKSAPVVQAGSDAVLMNN